MRRHFETANSSLYPGGAGTKRPASSGGGKHWPVGEDQNAAGDGYCGALLHVGGPVWTLDWSALVPSPRDSGGGDNGGAASSGGGSNEGSSQFLVVNC